MSDEKTCRALTKANERCTNRAKSSGYCGVHLPKPQSKKLGEVIKQRAETAGAVISTLGGVIALVEKLIEVWQSIPFGPGPKMPDDYRYLQRARGPFYDNPRDSHSPMLVGAHSVDWRLARRIYDEAHRSAIQDNDDELQASAKKLDRQMIELLGSMDSDVKRLLDEELGDVEPGQE